MAVLLLGVLVGLPACTTESRADPGPGDRVPVVELPSAPGELTVAAAGDICGDCEPTAALLEGISGLDLVVTLGDHAYEDGTLAEFRENYDPHWGRFNHMVRPVAGNHDHHIPHAQGYRDYFDLPSGPLYYSFDRDGWHFIGMDTDVMDATQVDWIAQNLASDDHTCEVSFGHHPRFSSGANHGSDADQDQAWRALVGGDVDIVLSAHDHGYERFAPMDAAGRRDPQGTRQFVAGTGGAELYDFDDPLPTSEARILEHGVLVLQLGDGTYSWSFVDTGGTVRDAGSGTCH